MILPKDVLSETYGALRYNRVRTVITMLGMAWGIATVVLLLAYGAGFSAAIVNIFKRLPACRPWALPEGALLQQAGGNKAGTNIRLTSDDIDRILANVPEVIRTLLRSPTTMVP